MWYTDVYVLYRYGRVLVERSQGTGQHKDISSRRPAHNPSPLGNKREKARIMMIIGEFYGTFMTG